MVDAGGAANVVVVVCTGPRVVVVRVVELGEVVLAGAAVVVVVGAGLVSVAAVSAATHEHVRQPLASVLYTAIALGLQRHTRGTGQGLAVADVGVASAELVRVASCVVVVEAGVSTGSSVVAGSSSGVPVVGRGASVVVVGAGRVGAVSVRVVGRVAAAVLVVVGAGVDAVVVVTGASPSRTQRHILQPLSSVKYSTTAPGLQRQSRVGGQSWAGQGEEE